MSKKYPDSEFEVSIDERYTAEEREAIAAEIMSRVRQRTLSGKDVNGRNFPGYEPKYVKSVDFKAAGKSKNQVNLRLSGEMLAYMEVLKNQKGKVVIGYSDEDQAGKAEGNNIGSYGGKKNPKKARNFLGINPKELSSILAKYPLREDARRDARTEAVLRAQEEVEEFTEKVQVEGLAEATKKELKDKDFYKKLKDKLRLKVGG